MSDSSKSLLEICPDISKQWDYKKNGSLIPEALTRGSKRKVWWICDRGHSYQARIDHRTVMHSGCPYCHGKKPIPGQNDLKTVFPDLAKEWDYDRNEKGPESFLSKSNKSVYWKCPYCGYSYKKTIVARTESLSGCPYCAKEKGTSFQEQSILFYLNKQFKTENRKVLYGREIDIYLPSLNTGIEYNGKYYHEKRKDQDMKKHDFLLSKGLRLIIIAEGNSNYFDEDRILVQSSESGHVKTSDLAWGIGVLFSLLNVKCPDVDLERDSIRIREQYIISQKKNNLASSYPEIAQEWDHKRNGRLKPENFMPGSNHYAYFDCPVCGSVYRRMIASRVNGVRCPVCAGKQVKKGYNDLATTHPHLIDEWSTRNTIKPDEITRGSDKKVWWHCNTCNNEWEASISSRTSGNVGCPVCAGKVVVPGYNDLETLNPDIASEWNTERNKDILPSQIRPGSNRRFWWKCKQCGFEWRAAVSDRIRGRGCPKCAIKARRDSRINTYVEKHGSISEIYPSIAKQWDNERNGHLTPAEVSYGSDQKVWWICPVCQNHWQATISSRTINGNGCPECGKRKCVVSSHQNRIKKRGSLAENRPDLALQWDYDANAPLTPDDVTVGSTRKVGWICSKGHKWVAVVYSRKKAGCPICAGRKPKLFDVVDEN